MSDLPPGRPTSFLEREWPYVLAVAFVLCLPAAYLILSVAGVHAPLQQPQRQSLPHQQPDLAAPEPGVAAAAVAGALFLALGALILASVIWLIRTLILDRPIFPPAETAPAQWTAWDVLKLICVYVAVIAVLIMPCPRERTDLFIMADSAARLLALALALHVIRSHGQHPADAFGLRSGKLARCLGPALGVFLALMPFFAAVNYLWTGLLQKIVGPELDVQQYAVKEILHSPSPALVAQIAISALFVAPLAEEFFFRGLIYGALRRRVGPGIAIPVVGLLFGLIHTPAASVAPMVVLGMILAWLYEKTATLAVPILLHALFNGIMLSLIMLVRQQWL